MHRQLGRDRSSEHRDAEVLDDHRVDARRSACSDGALDGLELLVEHERVQRHVAASAMLVEPADRAAELVDVEVRRTRAGVEALKAEIDRVGTGAYGSLERGAIAGRREDLGTPGRRRGAGHGCRV